jgi:L-threonylcarbamoyladenylate synthase
MDKIGTDIQFAASLLKAGELVAIPTETVYGLAANALDPDAVLRIYEVKNRPHFNPLIVHLSELSEASKYVRDIPTAAIALAEKFWPGPLTLLLEKSERIPDLVTAGSPLVAIRVPAHPLTLSLLKGLPFPLAAPSANPFGYISPTTAKHVEAQLGDKIPYILDGGPATVGIESTIVGFDKGGHALLYRQGGIPSEDMEAITGKIKMVKASGKPQTSGMLKSHYAPTTPLFLGDLADLRTLHSGKKIGLLRYSEKLEGVPADWQVVLSPSGDLHEAAKSLFSGLIRLDSMGLELILAETVPETGLGRAINDRLRRAQHKHKSL